VVGFGEKLVLATANDLLINHLRTLLPHRGATAKLSALLSATCAHFGKHPVCRSYRLEKPFAPDRRPELTSGELGLAARLRQEPGAAFRLIDPDFDQAGSRDVVVAVAKFMRLAEQSSQFQIVRAKLQQHLLRRD